MREPSRIILIGFLLAGFVSVGFTQETFNVGVINSVISLESQQQMAYDLEQLRTKRKRTDEDYTKEYQQLEFSLVTKIRNEVFPIIESVAKEKNFRLVLDLSVTGVAYVDPVIDITNEVIQRYDALISF